LYGPARVLLSALGYALRQGVLNSVGRFAQGVDPLIKRHGSEDFGVYLNQ
jgi:hypothetical protein